MISRGEGYATAVQLQHQPTAADNGRILLVFEQPDAPGSPLYESLDGGHSWRMIAQIKDQAHGNDPHWRLRWQPNLIEAPRASGDLAAGDILFAANATHGDHVDAERLQLYVSHDVGRTWRYLSDIVDGGGHPEDKGNKGVWEPNLRVLPDGTLVAYYSSEQHKDEGFNQLLAHKVSHDGGRTWSPEVVDVAAPGEVERPGMAVVDALPDGRFVMSYEDIDGQNNGQVHLKFSRDGLHWGQPSDRGTPVVTAGGAWPAASPIVIWIPGGGPNGRLVVVAERGRGSGSDEGGRTLFWNDDLGRGPWWQARLPVQKETGNIHAGWTQVFMPVPGGYLHVTSSSVAAAPENADANMVEAAVAPIGFDRYEAEDAARISAVYISTDKASNGGKVRLSVLPGSHLRFEIDSPAAGLRHVTLCVADVDRPTVPGLAVDGVAAQVLPSAATTAKSGWREVEGDIRLKAGRNVLDVTPGAHAVDVDYLRLTPPSA